jgi:hypothetical protein
MKSTNLWGRIVVVAALLLLAVGGTAFAQLQTGNLYGTVTDDQGAALPGVTVTLTGGGAPQVQVTNAEGQFRFLGLPPGTYAMKAELEGFSTIDYPNISIGVGRNTSIEVKLSAAVEDVITVTAESPLLDTRKVSTGATIAQTELEKIPTSRDPWSILSSTPGVLTDRINVGGNESGQQSAYTGPGSAGDQSIWAVDGMVITDMAALGSSPAYYDFDAFEEMQVTTGGSDSTIATGGVVLNMVTKRGTNEWKGTGRYLSTDKSNQSNLNFDKGELGKTGLHRSGVPPGISNTTPTQSAQASFKQGNRIVSVKDYGAEIGGPIIKDRLWIWGAYGRQKVDLLTIADVGDKTDLKTKNVKLNAQLAASNSATLFGLDSDKVKLGRNAGPTRPQETTWNQSHFGDTPTAAKVEDTHIFSSNFYLTGLYSKVNGGFQLVPQGGLGGTSFLDGGGIWHNTFVLFQTARPQKQYKGDASTFFNTGNLSHELKFGAGYREAEVNSLSQWGGVGVNLAAAAVGLPENLLAVQRVGGPTIKQKYTDAYVQDTLTVGNLTANIGLRYDKQAGENLGRSLPASSLFPNLLPAVSTKTADIGFDWTDITPRLGLTYALGADRKTLLRASFSRFATQLGTGTGSQLNPTAGLSYAYFFTTNNGNPNVTVGQIEDLDGNGIIDANDVLFYSGNVDPRNGGVLLSNGLSSNLSAPLTDEALLSVEHALLPEFVVGLNLTYRKIHNLIENQQLVFDNADSFCATCLDSIGRQATRADYELVTITGRNLAGNDGHPVFVPFTTPDGKPYTVQYYRLRSNVSTRLGTFLKNGGREQEYKGAAITFNKRLSNRWMLRGNFSYSDWTWSKVPQEDLENPGLLLGGGQREGDAVLQGSGTGSGSKGGVYINSKWSYSVNGLYQIAPDRPWGINAAVNFYGRQGYPIPYFHRVTLGGNEQSAGRFVQVTPRPDTYRLDDVHMMDARIEKEFTFSDFGLTLGVDCFNVFNKATVLQRNHRLQQSTSDDVREITSPRILRFGARLSFK